VTTSIKRQTFPDPYDDLSDDEFEREILEAIDQSTTKISLRVPRRLLERIKTVAGERGVPYQVLMKAVIEHGIQRLEQKRRRAAAGESAGH